MQGTSETAGLWRQLRTMSFPATHSTPPLSTAVSFFERAGNAHFNSIVVADADGSIVGHYRKSHIPDGPGCELFAVVQQAGAICSWECLQPSAAAWQLGGLPALPPSSLLLEHPTADQEKFYFNPGDTGFKVFKTRFADIGVLICWDQ